MVTKIYIVRHCQSTGNIEQRFQGRFDADVTPAGEKQTELLGLRFRNERIDAVYSSPLKRARLTAEAVAKYHDLPVNEIFGMIELNVGDMENLFLTEIAGKFPETARNWDEAPDLCEFPNGETMAEAYRRVNAALDELIAENEGKTVVLVTHGGVIRNLYARVSYGCPEGIRQSAVFGNTGVSLLRAEDGALSWEFLNDLSHLPEDLRRKPTVYKFSREVI